MEVNGTLGFELYDSVLNNNYDRICADTGGNATENSANVVFFSDSGDIIIRDCEFYQSLPLSDPKSGGGVKYKHSSQYPDSTFQVYNCTFTNHKFFAFGSGTNNTHFHHNIINGGGTIVSKDFGGTTHQTNQIFEYNTIYEGKGLALSPTNNWVNVDFPGDPCNIVFRNNIVYDTATSYSSERGIVDVGCYMTDVLYFLTLPELTFTENCYYNPNIAAQFNIAAGFNYNPDYAEGGQYSLADWRNTYGYDTAPSIEADPLFVDAPNGDFHLQGGSPATGMGMYAGTGPQPPGQASNPSPANSATSVSVDADLSWSAGSGSTSSDVYFGNDSTPDSGEFQGNQTATTYEPGTMANNTTYYWRIDEINANGTTTGAVWSFTTEAAAQPPGQASNPSPANSAADVSIDADLSWTAGTGSTSSDVYFGTDLSPDAGEFQGNQTATTYEPTTMANSTTYYWRIDEINANGTTTGNVWSFTTEAAPPPPGQASSPNPADSATDVGVGADLSWTAGSNATSRDVYFGTSSPGNFQANQTAVTFDPGTMDNDTTYYWRIDEINANGTTTGVVWSFTTEAAPVTIKINFQPAAAQVPTGYEVDSGEAYADRGNGLTYGWDEKNTQTRDRNADPDQRYDTLNHMQKQDDRTWEIELSSGTYDVWLVCGDPSYTDQVNTMDVEGTICTDPDGQDNFDEYNIQVNVTDGRLTITPAAGSSNSKICFVEITN